MDRRQRPPLKQLLILVLFAFPVLTSAEQEECNDARDRVQICCLNPSACLSADQRNNQAKVETCQEAANGTLSLNQIARNRCTPALMMQIQDEINKAAEKKCSAAIDGCMKACKGLDAELIDECQKSKTELEKVIQQQPLPAKKAAADSEVLEMQQVEQATKAVAPTPEPGDDPISAQH